MKLNVKSTTFILAIFGLIPFINTQISKQAIASQTEEVTIKFAGKVGNNAFSCGTSYQLGKPATTVTALDFRFYVSDIALIDANGKAVPLNLKQDGKWQYQNVALIDFENKTGGCANGTIETSDRIVGTIPKGNYKGLKFTLGVPSNLNHEDSTLAPSPLNLTSLWWSWRLGYKFARIDFENQRTAQATMHKQHQHNDKENGNGFLIHLGSTGCQAETSTQKPAKECSNPNTSTITFTNFNPAKNIVVADIARLLASTNLNRNQPNTSPGCMSEPNDNDCAGIMASFGIPFGGISPKPTFFRVE